MLALPCKPGSRRAATFYCIHPCLCFSHCRRRKLCLASNRLSVCWAIKQHSAALKTEKTKIICVHTLNMYECLWGQDLTKLTFQGLAETTIHLHTFIGDCWPNSIFPKLVDAYILIGSGICNVEVCTFTRFCKDRKKLSQSFDKEVSPCFWILIIS